MFLLSYSNESKTPFVCDLLEKIGCMIKNNVNNIKHYIDEQMTWIC